MYYISICDSNIKSCSDIENLLLKYETENHCSFEIEVWNNGENLCQFLQEHDSPDFLFINPNQFNADGTNTGVYIRNELKNTEIKIILIEPSTRPVINPVLMQPVDYLPMPAQKTELYALMDRVLFNEAQDNSFFEFSFNKKTSRIPYEKIICFASENKKIHIFLQEKELSYYGQLKALKDRLPPCFLQIHQSYIINMDYVTQYTKHLVILMEQFQLPISKPYRESVFARLSAYIA